MAAGAVDQTGTYVFAVYPQIVEDGKAKDSSWMVGDGYDSMFTIWNPSREPEDLVATFSYLDGSTGYKLPVHLDAYASANIDMASLIEAQQPDTDGKVIPRGTTEGRVVVSSPKGLNTRIEFALSSSAFNVTTATCCPNCTCCFGTFYVYMSPSSATVGTSNTTQLHFMDNEWGGVDDDSCDVDWSSENTSYATVSTPDCINTGGVVTGVAAGGVDIHASEIVNPSGQVCSCSPGCPGYLAEADASVAVIPVISGTNTVWYFNGQTVSGYTTTATLTANGANSSATWTITAGSNKISLSTSTGSSTNVSSSGTVFSGAVGDITLTVTSGGQTSAPFALTTRLPYELVAGAVTTTCSDSYGYDTHVNYTIEDQLGSLLPSTVPLNENWTTGVADDYSGENWGRTNPGGTTVSNSAFYDEIGGGSSRFISS